MYFSEKKYPGSIRKTCVEIKDLFNLYFNSFTVIDIYMVENAHFVTRRHSVDAANKKQIKQNIRAIFSSNASQCDFRSAFTTPKNHIFSPA